MKPPDEVLLALVHQWITKADLDYRTAERLLLDADPIRESIAFHCQSSGTSFERVATSGFPSPLPSAGITKKQ